MQRTHSRRNALLRACRALMLLCLTTGCSTILEGRTQEIEVTSNPPGASCLLKSDDEVIGVVDPTPGRIKVEKSKYDIVVECTKDGYQKGKAKDHSSFAITSLGNMVMGQYSFIGTTVDSITGAANKYDASVNVAMNKEVHLAAAEVVPLLPTVAPQPASTPVEKTQPKPTFAPTLKLAQAESVSLAPPSAPKAAPPVLNVLALAEMPQTMTVAELPVSNRQSVMDQ